jgi:hypothetical protein
MKAISRYQRAIDWIAQHDAGADTQEKLAVSMLHVALVAHTFEKDAAQVGQHVLARRRAHQVDTYPTPADTPAREIHTGGSPPAAAAIEPTLFEALEDLEDLVDAWNSGDTDIDAMYDAIARARLTIAKAPGRGVGALRGETRR